MGVGSQWYRYSAQFCFWEPTKSRPAHIISIAWRTCILWPIYLYRWSLLIHVGFIPNLEQNTKTYAILNDENILIFLWPFNTLASHVPPACDWYSESFKLHLCTTCTRLIICICPEPPLCLINETKKAAAILTDFCSFLAFNLSSRLICPTVMRIEQLLRPDPY